MIKYKNFFDYVIIIYFKYLCIIAVNYRQKQLNKDAHSFKGEKWDMKL